MKQAYVFVGDRGELVGKAVFTAHGQTAELDQTYAEEQIANGFPLLPADVHAESAMQENPRFAAGLALEALRLKLFSLHTSAIARPELAEPTIISENHPATPGNEVNEHVAV